MQKFWALTALAAAAVLSVTTASAAVPDTSPAPLYKDGVYMGEGAGRASIIKVVVTVKDGKIKDVKSLEHRDTAM